MIIVLRALRQNSWVSAKLLHLTAMSAAKVPKLSDEERETDLKSVEDQGWKVTIILSLSCNRQLFSRLNVALTLS